MPTKYVVYSELKIQDPLSNHDDYGNNVINFAYLIMKNSSFARFARAFFNLGLLRHVLVLFTLEMVAVVWTT